MTAIGLQDIVVADTAISYVNGEKGQLVYRGHWAKDLAVHHTFEEVAHLIWYGSLPSPEKFVEFQAKFVKERELPDYIHSILNVLPADMTMMDVIRTVISALGTSGYEYPPTFDQAISLTAKLPTIIAYRYHRLRGREIVKPRKDLLYSENYLYMLNGECALPAQVRALDSYMVLTIEHGMNSSTFAGRVVASTHSDLVSSITAALGALKGPLHGGAPAQVTAMLEAIGTKENAEHWVRNALEQGTRLMGFGHRIYKTVDPRAVALRDIAQQLAGDDYWLDLAIHTEDVILRLLKEYKPNLKLNTNVEFYSAAVMKAVGLDGDLFTPTFAASRMVGWTAHCIEAVSSRLIYPESRYIGDMPAVE
ncbi:citrate synthase/methylcitrate synthase [Fodinisporobacter ferrooxydans]|uniref:Citrate synthase n=1 Tax=Fodinisporobacter ferrooxydans TaxID=2901836 RepID=A0ABY4CRE2_9BACL|nr:citrate synthase/methylcitrate synthase [Alicyclobacillaceae bacterium MYW30-H2]